MTQQNKSDDQKVNEVLKKMLNTPPVLNKPIKEKESDKKGWIGLSSAVPLTTKRTSNAYLLRP